MSRIALSEPTLGGNAARYLDECLRSNYVSSVGPFVERFEREFADYVGARFAVACASGTAALHVALRVVGVGAGDEVFVPNFTFIASANAVSYQGGSPTLVEPERASWNADPTLILEELERRARRGEAPPRAVEIVHVLGHPAHLELVAKYCRTHGIPLVEDAAEALGARYREGPLAGRHVGTIGDFGCFSFNGNKVITTGAGGMLVTDDEALAERARHLTTQAKVKGRGYMHDDVGYNYRLSNLAAALGVAQLEELPKLLEKKREIAARYDAALGGLALTLPPRLPWATPSFWLYSILVDRGRREAILDRLEAASIEVRPLWTPLSRVPVYRAARRLGEQEIAGDIADSGISLPCSAHLSRSDQERVVATLRAALG